MAGPQHPSSAHARTLLTYPLEGSSVHPYPCPLPCLLISTHMGTFPPHRALFLTATNPEQRGTVPPLPHFPPLPKLVSPPSFLTHSICCPSRRHLIGADTQVSTP